MIGVAVGCFTFVALWQDSWLFMIQAFCMSLVDWEMGDDC